jgi:hypothetical protein
MAYLQKKLGHRFSLEGHAHLLSIDLFSPHFSLVLHPLLVPPHRITPWVPFFSSSIFKSYYNRSLLIPQPADTYRRLMPSSIIHPMIKSSKKKQHPSGSQTAETPQQTVTPKKVTFSWFPATSLLVLYNYKVKFSWKFVTTDMIE